MRSTWVAASVRVEAAKYKEKWVAAFKSHLGWGSDSFPGVSGLLGVSNSGKEQVKDNPRVSS